jgi:integrase
MGISKLDPGAHKRRPWNAGSSVGAKRPLKPRDVWAIGFFLDEHRRMRDRALFDLAIDSKLRRCDVIKLKIGDVVCGGSIRNRATVIQQKTGRPVQFELMTDCRKSLLACAFGWASRRRECL